MYCPAAFRVSDLEQIQQFLVNYSNIAILITSPNAEDISSSSSSTPIITHIPLVYIPEEHALYGHVARANSHWKHMQNRSSVAIFSGPNGYISPTFYASPMTRNVPSWNYIAVHAKGIVQVFDQKYDEDRKETKKCVELLTKRFEAGKWNMEDAAEDYIEKQLHGIVGFRMKIDSLEAKWKLSQNKSKEDRESVIFALNNSGQIELAQEMKKCL
jgi:transcriptional regulator